MHLETLWFLLLGAMVAAYAALDGFDFGVGILSVLAPNDDDRGQLRRSIGPFWDGNEVWLVVFGGTLLGAFPEAYATILSGFYGALIAVLVALIVRAAALEFRNRVDGRRWRALWDAAFFAASLAAPFLFGAAVGAALLGIPLGSDGIYRGGTLAAVVPDRLAWYPALVGAMTVALFTLHGALFLELKVDAPMRPRVRRWRRVALPGFLGLYAIVTVTSVVAVPSVHAAVLGRPWAWVLIVLSLVVLALVARWARKDRPRRAFLGSAALVFCLLGLVATSLYPNLVISSVPDGQSLTIHNAASSHATLSVLTVMMVLGMPLALVYFTILFRTFRGRVDAA